MLRDFDQLHNSVSKSDFEKAQELFKAKWTIINPTIAEYIDRVWFKQFNTWYIGAAPGVPAHNNNVESFNSIIKRCYSFREKLPMLLYIDMLIKILFEYSEKYLNDQLTIALEPSITDETFTKADETRTRTMDSTDIVEDNTVRILCPAPNFTNVAQVIYY